MRCAVMQPAPGSVSIVKVVWPLLSGRAAACSCPIRYPCRVPVIPMRAGRLMSLRSVGCDSVEWHPPPGRTAPVLGGRCEAALRRLRSGRPFGAGFDVMACHRSVLAFCPQQPAQQLHGSATRHRIAPLSSATKHVRSGRPGRGPGGRSPCGSSRTNEPGRDPGLWCHAPVGESSEAESAKG